MSYYSQRKQRPSGAFFLERVTGIEPASPAWEAGILPLNHTRVCVFINAYYCITNRLFLAILNFEKCSLPGFEKYFLPVLPPKLFYYAYEFDLHAFFHEFLFVLGPETNRSRRAIKSRFIVIIQICRVVFFRRVTFCRRVASRMKVF